MDTKQYLVSMDVDAWLADAKGIAWDTCHKIYILMDDEQMTLMEQYEYDPLISKAEMDADQMLDEIVKWWEDSCGLRFIQAVTTYPEEGEEQFVDVIGQFEIDREEEDE